MSLNEHRAYPGTIGQIMRFVLGLLCSLAVVVSTVTAHFHPEYVATKTRSLHRTVMESTPCPSSSTPAPLQTPEWVCPPRGFGCAVPSVPSLPETFEEIFEARVNHVGILLHTDQEVVNQLNAYQNLGIGPFVPAGSTSSLAQYCGQNVTLNVTVYVGGVPALLNPTGITCADAKHAFFEISQVTSTGPDLYRDFYDMKGPGAFYFGIGLKPNATRDQMLDLLARKGQKLYFSYSFPYFTATGQPTTAYADFVRIGYVMHEIVSGEGVYLP